MSSYSEASSSLLSLFAASVSRGSPCNLAGSIRRHGTLRLQTRRSITLQLLLDAESIALRPIVLSFVDSRWVTAKGFVFFSGLRILAVLASTVVNAPTLFSLLRFSISSNIDVKFGKLSILITMLMAGDGSWKSVENLAEKIHLMIR